MRGKLIWPIFWALVAVAIGIACILTISVLRDQFSGYWLFLVPLAVFFLLGVALIVFTLRSKVAGGLRKFLLLTGASAAGFFLSVLLHNGFYALAEISSHIAVLKAVLDFLQAAFFCMAVPVCPLGFLVGAVGAVILGARSRQTAG